MGNTVVTWILLALRLGIGVILFRLALNPRYRHLHWLAAVFYLNFVSMLLRGPVMGPLSQVLMVVIHICLAMFTHATFYQQRRSPVAWIIGGLVVTGGTSLYLTLRVPPYLGPQPISYMCAINWFWHALVAWQVWRKLRADRSIEDWIKARYVLVVIYGVVMGALFILPLWRSPSPVLRWSWPISMMIALVLQYLAWGMPGPLRRYLNRNYQEPVVSVEV